MDEETPTPEIEEFDPLDELDKDHIRTVTGLDPDRIPRPARHKFAEELRDWQQTIRTNFEKAQATKAQPAEDSTDPLVRWREYHQQRGGSR